MQLFDITFQSGEFNFSEGSGMSKVYIAVFSLIGGFVLNVLYEGYKEQKSLKRQVEEFLFELQPIVMSLEQQVTLLNEFAKTVEEPNIKSIPMPIVNNLLNLPEKFDSYSKIKLTKYFIRKSKNKEQTKKDIYNLYNHFSFISKSVVSIENVVPEIKDNLNEYISLWDQNIVEIMHKNNEYVGVITSSNYNPTNDAYIRAYATIYGSYVTSGNNKNPFEIYDRVILPLIQLRVTYVNDIRVLGDQNALSSCSIAFNQIKKLKSHYAERMRNLAATLNDSKNLLSQIINRLG